MDAKDARELATKTTLVSDSSQFNQVIEKIKKEASQGRYTVSLSISLREGTRKMLENRGYKVEHSSHRNEDYTSISW